MGNISIKLFSPVLKPGPARAYEISEKTTIVQFLEETGIQDTDTVLILVNGRPSRSYTELKDGDVLSILTLLDGG